MGRMVLGKNSEIEDNTALVKKPIFVEKADIEDSTTRVENLELAHNVLLEKTEQQAILILLGW